MSSNLLPVSPMATETVRDSTVPNHDETELTEFQRIRNDLFLKYETLSADPLPHVKRLAEFMGYGFTDEEEKNGVVEKVVNLCSFETMKNLEANKGDKEREDHPSPYTNSTYFGKGKTGDWVNYLTPEMAARMDGIMEEKFKGTGLLENGE
uniref:Sulfotransferase n=1 Tax=Brassica oleracea var. oleracea TaxID=109376 RepID=A0A0D3CWR1_BRAOL